MNIWDALSRRFHGASKAFLKHVAYKSSYGGTTDPWLDHMVREEIDDLLQERAEAHRYGIR